MDTSTTAPGGPSLLESKLSFLQLPFEIRQQVYDHAVPVCRLAPFPYLDAEWSMRTAEHRGTPALMLTSRKLYDEVTPLVYSHAILEVAPAQQGHNFFHIQTPSTNKTIPFSYSRLLNTFRFYNKAHLKLIRHAHVFSNQADVIDGECYETLLQFLVEHTSTIHIELSSRPMTRIRGKAHFYLPSWRATFYDNPSPTSDLRIVRIWTKSKRTPWEYERMMRLRCKVNDGTLCPMQIYFWSTAFVSNGASDVLQLDPRWLTRSYAEPEEIDVLTSAVPLIDELMKKMLKGNELKDYRDNSRYFEGEHWVYQMIVVGGLQG